MSKRQVLDAEGKPIDPSANLGEFLQAIPQSDIAEVTASAPTWETVTFEVDDPELKGKTGKDAVALLEQTRANVKQQEERAAGLERQLAQERQQAAIENTTRRVLQEQQAKPPEPTTPLVDPREAQIDELWWTNPPEARRLLAEMNDERAAAKADVKAKEAETRILQTIDERDKRTLAHQSFRAADATLRAEGLALDQIRAAAVLQLVGNPQHAYFANGGLYKPENLIAAAHTLFGTPTPAPATPTVNAPIAAAPQQAAPMVVPPGSAKPAPAAAPARKRSTSLDPRMERDYEHMADIYGLDKDKLLARRAARIQREGEH